MATIYLRGSARSTGLTQHASGRKLSITLWSLQAVLALVFTMTGAMKLLLPADVLADQSPLPILLVRFIGACEVAGALGMIMPGLLRIRPSLTPLAAACLALLMICATVLTPIVITPDPVMMMMPACVGIVAAFVAYARLRLAPLRSRS